MYGSCATDLDLPSSDLDVVVRGLEETEQSSIVSEGQGAENSNPEARTEEKQSAGSDVKSLQSVDKGKKQSPVRTNNLKHQFPMVYSHISTNAERVVTLAVELERQPWAVHVKAIPTASVPVIKILADPAKLQGVTVENDDWHLQQALIGQPSMDTAGNTNLSDSRSQYPVSPAHLTWRGADVVNGLLKVDITFEGPEHGGIGSTKFSKRVVEEFSEESSLPPDSTAAVQVLMVLKELLAQRRLNEPFSGGLSSYALLLLVISIVRERAIIRKELERVERQRRVVAAGGGNAVPTPVDNSIQRPGDESSSFIKKRGPMDTVTNINGKGEFHNASATKYTLDADIKLESSDSSPCRTIRKTANDEKNQCLGDGKWMKRSSGHDGIALNSGGSTSSSWASVARKTSPPPSKKASEGSSQSAASTDNRDTSLKKLGSFADVLTKGAVQGDQENKDTTVITSDLKLKGISPEDSGVPSGKGSAKMNVQDHSNQARKVASSLPVGAHAFEPSVSMGYSASFHTKQNASSVAEESGSFFPQSFHDVIEVLSSGEITPGKLLMHFLLFYGQHFDSHSTAIDYSNTHKRDSNGNSGYGVASPYMQRRNTGSYDPVTGMLTVDPIVVYDPLEGAELNNVARSCFAWSSIRWVFAQSYMTLSSAVEMSAGHIPGKGSSRGVHSPYASSSTPVIESHPSGQEDAVWGVPYGHDESGNIIFDPSTPLLELLLSF